MRLLGDILVSGKHITEEQLATALVEQKREGVRLGEWLVKEEVITADTLFDAICDQFDAVAFEEEQIMEVDYEVFTQYDVEVLRRIRSIPVYGKSKSMVVATADPAMLYMYQEEVFGSKVVLLAVFKESLFESVFDAVLAGK